MRVKVKRREEKRAETRGKPEGKAEANALDRDYMSPAYTRL